MKMLNGSELAVYIKERQAGQVKELQAANGVAPKLAIVATVDNPVTEVYLRLKQRYGKDIGIDVDVHRTPQAEAKKLLNKLSNDKSVNAIIVQLPLQDTSQTEEIVNLVPPAKDVDGLGADPIFDPATPMSILWLLAGYNVDLPGKRVLIVGRGKLVGAPLARMLAASGIEPEVAHSKTVDLKHEALQADVIITATGRPGILRADMLKQGAVVVDAGVAGAGGKTVGDLDPDVYERDDLTLTPRKGGVGPLTVSALFENVIRATARQAGQ